MSTNFEMLEKDPRNTVIKVIGVGGGGGNAVQYMVNQGMKGIEFIAANTDHQALAQNGANVVLQLGENGLGAGANPEVGQQAAEDSAERIRDAIAGAHLLFITAGMGGGTGTGAAPVIARIAKEEGILTVGVVTKPFTYEGTPRMKRAEMGIENLKQYVDSIIVILNDKLEDEFGEDATLEECFNAVNEVLYKACSGIAEIIHTPGFINVDFKDLSTVMREHGTALMGSSTASGPDRAEKAATAAVTSPLLEGTDLHGARGLLVNITASNSLKLSEPNKVMKILNTFVSPGANVIFGSARDDSMGDELRVTVVATGMDRPLSEAERAKTGMRPSWSDVFVFDKSPSEAKAPEKKPAAAPKGAAPRAEPRQAARAVPAEERDEGDASSNLFGYEEAEPQKTAPKPEQPAKPRQPKPSPSVWSYGEGFGRDFETPSYLRKKS